MFIKKAQYDHILRFYISIAAPCQKELEVLGKGSTSAKLTFRE